MSTAAKQKADEFKDRGNVLFKEGRWLELTVDQAEAAAPQENVYPSNLSAALYEMGDYSACLDAISRSWTLSASPALALRLATRAAKALAQGVRGGTIGPVALAKHAQPIAQLETIAMQQESSAGVNIQPECVRVWREWHAIAAEAGDRNSAAHDARVRLAAIPIARRGVNPMLQYYTMGQDEMLSLFDDWGPRDPYSLKINTFSKAKLSKVSFLFGGVGDARNVFATLVGAHRAYKALPKDKRSALCVHLTLLDIHPSALARDLVVLMLLNDCMTGGVSPTTLAEIKATLMYTYAAAVMPPYAHARAPAIPALQASLAYWATNTSKTTRGMLGMYQDAPDPSIVAMLKMPGLSANYRALLKARVDAPLRQINSLIDTWGPAEARAAGLGLPEWSNAMVMKELKERRAHLAEIMLEEHLSGNLPPRLGAQAMWFKMTRTLVPPKELWSKHPEIEEWNKCRSQQPPSDEPVIDKLKATMETTWKPNMTLFDREYSELSMRSLPNCKGYPDLQPDAMNLPRLFDAFNRRFGIDAGGELPANAESPAFTHTMRFFQGAVDALKALEGKVTLEIVCGGVMEELGRMRLGTDTERPAQFPRTFTRAYLSNVPDYTHGVLNTAMFVVLCLQPDSAVASNCLMNSGLWKDDDEFCHNYSLLHPRDVPRFLGCETIRMDGIMDLVTLGSKALPRPIAELATRAELTRWLTRVLLYTCVPGTPGMQVVRVRMPNNLVAFIRLLVHLHAVGYPAHWLAEFLQTVLSDTLVTDVVPYTGTFPIPLSDLGRSVPARRVRLDPWLAELENVLVAGKPKGPEMGPRFVTAPVQDNVVDILLYKPSKTLTADALARLIPSILEGRTAEPPKGVLSLLSSQESVDLPMRKVIWRLSREKARQMRKEGWVMVVYRTDNHEAVTLPLPAKWWTEVLVMEQLDVD
ncbi:hypothetical protein DFH08DRAFT_940827 [Mycena albidolilacea]|uniref:DUF4470 domain-containing protein n=1 Tax=Mycena albidolilacea TaxID=1033008 RepID=A0AAD6ZLP2_9AGAR|nr:hypothetical protein DFH08DRAFT_940827 [Mycena albidolilacea]